MDDCRIYANITLIKEADLSVLFKAKPVGIKLSDDGDSLEQERFQNFRTLAMRLGSGSGPGFPN